MKYHVFKDDKHEWRWKLVVAQDLPIAVSGVGFQSEADCRAAIEIVKMSGSAPVVKD